MDTPITRAEHEEFRRAMETENQRLADEDKRQNRRISALEENVKEIHELTLSVGKMAVNMENMLNAIERQGNLIERQNDRIDEMEREPAKDQKEIKMEIIKTTISALVGAVVVAVCTLL